jgi:hypothetical protein
MLNRLADCLKRGITTIGRIDDGDMDVRDAWMPKSLLNTIAVMLFGTIVFAVSKDNKFGLV